MVGHQGGPELLAPLAEHVPILVDAEMIRPGPEITPTETQIYKASAVIRAGGNASAARFLAQVLPAHQPARLEPILDLIKGALRHREFGEAEKAATAILETWPEVVQARDWRAVARAQQGRYEEALADLEACLEVAGEHPERLFNKGLVLSGLERWTAATEALRRAVELRPNHPRALTYLGLALEQLQDDEAAEQAFRRSLAVDPVNARTNVRLAQLLLRRGQGEEARRILRAAQAHSSDPEQIQQALGDLDP